MGGLPDEPDVNSKVQFTAHDLNTVSVTTSHDLSSKTSAMSLKWRSTVKKKYLWAEMFIVCVFLLAFLS